MPSVPWRVEFSKIFKIFFFKIPKMPKIVPKSIQTCFERVLGQTFRKFFAQFSMAFRILENFQKNQKNFKIPKTPKIVPKRIQTCFDCNLGQFFRKIFAQCSMEARVFENFLKNQKILKIQKCPKSFPKKSKHVLNMFWGKLFEKFLPSFPWNVESSKIFKKKYFQNSKNAQKFSQNYPNVFEGDFFEKKNYARCSMEGRVFENFQFFFQKSKNAQNRSRKHPNVF